MFAFGVPAGRAGLTLELHFYRNNEGGSYAFYTPLYTNSTAPAAPLGAYFISSPHEPTNGSVRGFFLTANGISDIPGADSEHFYGDFDSAIYQITNGNWTILFTNATTTNVFQFQVTAQTITSNMLPATTPGFPSQGAFILTNETHFSWQVPTGWPATGRGQVYNLMGYNTQSNLSAGQTNWIVDAALPPGDNYTFLLQFLYTNTLFAISTPTNTASSQPFAGWDSYSILDTGIALNFVVVPNHGVATRGHTLLANYTFEDNNLPVHDFSGSGNDMSYAWFVVPPTIVTNDAAAGTYAGGLGGSGWFAPPARVAPLFAGSFSVSLWLKTTNVHGSDTADLFSSAGIVSDLGNDYGKSPAPMLQSGRKLGFHTGGTPPNLLRSHANINTGQYVHVVTTRDQQTGEKAIYINGVLDTSAFASTNVLVDASNGDLTVGYNNAQVFSGQVDEIQFYSGVLSSNEVAFLHSHPGTNVADVLQLDVPVARYDFEDTNNPGIDTSGHHNDSSCFGSIGVNVDVGSTNAIVGNYARQFFGDSLICFAGNFPNLSNALSADFSVTAWINTTNSINSDFDQALYGMPVFSAYSEDTNGTIPLSITGSKAAFSIYNTNGTDTTIHSTTSINDGRYHFIAVTRTRTNGLMRLYVDGVPEASAVGNSAPIRTDGTIFIGGGTLGYAGLIDDVRLYAGALAPEDVAELAANGALTFGSVLGTSNVLWNTSGDSQWFIETTNTYGGAPAAIQSGSVSDGQRSTLSTTVTGPGDLSFVWQNPTLNDLDLEFDLDGNYQADIGGFTDWTLTGPFHIGPGQHTLSWTVYGNVNTDTNDAAFLAQVVFVPSYLVAHFDFDDTNAGVLPIVDVSTNGNDMGYGFGFNSGGTAKSTDAVAGARSLNFFRDPINSFSGGQVGWKPTPPGLLSTLAGSFSVSLWIKTTNHTGTAGAAASDGNCIVVADIPGDAFDVTAVSLNGGAVAFGTGGTPGDDTLTSAKSVSDNNWHHVVVTRDQLTGQKRIFIDGSEDTASPGIGSTALLDAPQSLSIGARLNASYSDPDASRIIAGPYEGLIDDLQIYSRPLSDSEVAFLHSHPGKEVINPGQNIPYAVQLRLEIRRNLLYTGNGQDYVVFPFIVSSTPAPITHHEIISPTHAFFSRTDPDSANSSDFNSLADVINECTNGLWWLILNSGDPSEKDLHFSVSISGLDTNVLAAVSILSPTNGTANVTRAPMFQWSGPTNFESLEVIASTPSLPNFNATLPPASTNWSAPLQLNYGTNEFGLRYISNNFPLVAFTTPTDINTLVPISNWVATATLQSSAASDFIVGAPAPLAVRLGSFQLTTNSFQLSFATLAGRPHILQGSTNLFNWADITNFVGDGSVQQFVITKTNKLKFFRVITQ